MAKGNVLKFLLWLLSTPQIAFSLLAEFISTKSFSSDLQRCVDISRQYGESVPSYFVEALIIAEDHRSTKHPGIDPIAIFRAIWVRFYRGEIQGASTIEQQFVRVVTNRYEKTIARKIREQILALMIVRRINKREIASAYLSIAFYGSSSIGKSGLVAKFGEDLSIVPFEHALRMVAQLKYPQPLIPSSAWHDKLESRCMLLLSRVALNDKKTSYASEVAEDVRKG
ncbi:MAG: hypothetical protein CML22_14260 [Rheinheimera sp.]|nr:hypothetical protein [Rheinheimera sp.]MBM35448.1 hypothetical protein [Rheinheimera sp.]HAW93634.1 hypothetical protein [Candidatus Azambacteria bacterium]